MERRAYTNRLAREKSPYLLQHAHNPVDWYPWGDEAFEKARRENKPIFLSIGYSTCHWCHVMERESFENEEIAGLLNEHFVAVKVDREERPDVDQVYMAAVQAMGEQGGWPLSVFLTPDRRPFSGGTYFPPEDRWGRIGFPTLLRRVAQAWKERNKAVIDDARVVATAISTEPVRRQGALGRVAVQRAVEQFEASYDPVWGGFGHAPKFPRSVALEFLMRRGAFEMVEHTLVQMAQGGLYDLVGGGFHRYSTDEKWLVPHFEKMLYDNALLARAYVQAWQITKDPFHERIARETLGYILRDLVAPEGAFYCAEDADSEGVEGKFYVWDPREVGNEGILRVAPRTTLDGEWKKKLFEARSRRVRPHRDDKILAEWNALAIGALACAGAALDEPSYVAAAERAARFILTTLRRPDGRLLRRYREGEAAIPAYLDDYAALADALVDLYQATFKVEYVEEAVRVAEDMIALFVDPNGGFWLTAKDGESLVARPKEIYDGALPSGNAVALHALARLADLTSREDFRTVAEAAVRAFASIVELYPAGYPHLLSAVDRLDGPSRQIVLAGDAPEMVRVVRGAYLPDAVVVWVPEEGPDDRTRRAIPITKERKAIQGKAAAYLCEGSACGLPLTDVRELEKLLALRR
ncbi:MAG: thioredoxin domain-containing protein [Planctomycetes bacterium]|nr:thioredoxin domain-containing protein [Planctomycetota bacterium]